jgi:hypothetical protein
MSICVACGEFYTGCNHHCDEKREQAINERRTHFDEPRVRTQPFWERLQDGFGLLDDDEDEGDDDA